MATTQNFSYPSSSDVTLTGTPNNAPIPSTSILVAGENPAGNQEPLQTDTSGNLNVNVIGSALPAGAATSANQTLEITQLTGIHSDTTSLDGKTVHVDTGNVTVVGSALPTGAATASLQTSGNASLSTIASTVSTAALQTSGNASLSAIEAAVSTAANQTTGNASLSSIDGKTPALGQALAASSVPVVLPAAQITALTPPTSVTVTQATGTNLHAVVDASALPSGASTSALQTTINTTLTNGSQKTQVATPTALTITQAALTVGTTATRLTVSGSAPASTRVALVVTPDAASTGKFYIGSSTVTASGATRGIQIIAGQTFIANNDAGDYWIVSDTASQTVEILEQA